MIIIKLQGGLGNQLFQYALGKTIEKKYKKEVKYDTSSYQNGGRFTPRSYLLDKFNTNVKIASYIEIKETKGTTSYLIKKVLNKFFFKKFNISYEADFLESVKNKNVAYLEGYWQNFRYVEPFLEELKKEVILKNGKLGGILLEGESVAVHIRRGDYLNTNGDLQVLDISYYKKAVDVISKKVKDPHYYIFTDDSLWAKENLDFLEKEKTTHVADFMLHDYEELMLLTQCKNVIIANSSFSWWGAMLNHNKGAIIVCPKDWRNVLLKNDENLCPEEWVRL